MTQLSPSYHNLFSKYPQINRNSLIQVQHISHPVQKKVSNSYVYNQNRKAQMDSEKGKAMFQEYYEIKRMFQLPLKIRLFFSTLQGLIQRSSSTQMSKQQVVDHQLMKGIGHQSQEEKVALLLAMMKCVQQYFERSLEAKTGRLEQNEVGTINHIETTCQMQTFSFKLSHWVSVKFKFDKLRRLVVIVNKKKNILVNLENYLIRSSKKHKFTIVFEAISKEVSEQNKKISLYFRQELFQKIWTQLFNCVVEVRNQQLMKLIKTGQDEQPQKHMTQTFSHQKIDKSLVFLSSEQITFYLKFKSQIIQRLKVGGFSFKNIYCKQYQYEAIRIDRSSKIDKIFKLQCQFHRNKDDVKRQFLQNLATRYKYKLSSTILEEFSKKYKAVYDRYLIKNKVYEQICIKQQTHSDQEEIYFMKGVQNIMTGNHLEFMIVKVKPTDKEQICRLVLVASVILGKDINLEIVIAFLLEFRDMLTRKQTSEEPKQTGEGCTNISDEDEDFYTIISQNDMNQKLYEIQELNEPVIERIDYDNNELDIQLKKNKLSIGQAHLKHKFVVYPEPSNGVDKSKIIKQHFLFKDWARCKNGGVVCLNEEMLTQQKKMIKKIFTSIGSNFHKIIKGGVLNVSLPVNIFKKESHLQSIAMNFSYAPLLLDHFQHNDKDQLERFKAAIIFTISVSILGISSQKPFNPILGETLQCFVAGCPLYIQQISHHPPISSYFFQGRGYKITGQIDPKISMGLNSGKCCSEKPNYIEFQDGTVICMSYGKMVIKGLILGDRQFHYEDKIFCYDMKNHYFADILFGPRKRSLGKSQPDDFISGKIYRTTSSYLSKFKEKIPPIFPSKEEIAKQICQIEGIWNQAILIDGKQMVNFARDLPYKLQNEEFPLPSNSTYRKDLSLYIQGDVAKAQEHKELMEQAQRRDRKLRQSRNKK